MGFFKWQANKKDFKDLDKVRIKYMLDTHLENKVGSYVMLIQFSIAVANTKQKLWYNNKLKVMRELMEDSFSCFNK